MNITAQNTNRCDSRLKVVDFGPFNDGSDKQGVANAIVDSFRTTGFVYLINHGLPDKKVAAINEWVHTSRNKLDTYLLTCFVVKEAILASNGSQAARTPS